jgi:hypothetical protein
MTKWSEAARQHAIKLRRESWINHADRDRAKRMAELYQCGQTLQQIGDEYGMTRERVRQILRKETTVTTDDGGRAVRTRRNKQAKQERITHLGIPYAEWKRLIELGRQMKAEGAGAMQVPTRAFGMQRVNAKRRGIEWRLTFVQWWDIWQRSGHWEERGRGHGFAMCRYGDKGPYAVNNVYIGTNAENVKHYHARLRMEAA